MREIYPFCKYSHLKLRQTNVIVMILIGITSLLYTFICIQSYITKTAINNNSDSTNINVSIKIYSLLLLLPQITFFLIFTIVFYTWFTLAHSFIKNLDYTLKRLKIVLGILNILLWISIIVYYIGLPLVTIRKDLL